MPTSFDPNFHESDVLQGSDMGVSVDLDESLVWHGCSRKLDFHSRKLILVRVQVCQRTFLPPEQLQAIVEKESLLL
jgi:hypothetical protein